MLAVLGVVSPTSTTVVTSAFSSAPLPAVNNGSAFGGPLWEDAGSLVQMEGLQEMGQKKKE